MNGLILEKEELCPRCGGSLDQHEYDSQFHGACGWPHEVKKTKVPLPAWLGPDTPENRARLQAFVKLKRTITSKQIEAAARAIDPNCFWDEEPPNLHQVRKKDRAIRKAAAALYAAEQVQG